MTRCFYFLSLAAVHSAAMHWVSLDSLERALANLPAAQYSFRDTIAAGSYLLAMTVLNCFQAIAVIGRMPQMVAGIHCYA